MNSGIYRIANISTGRMYIGQAINIWERIKKHKTQLRGGRHHSVALQRAWDKYGEGDFNFSVVEYVPPSSWMLTRREQKHIDTAARASLLLNSARTAGLATRTGTTHSDEAKAKISAAHKGRVTSEAARRNLSSALIGHAVSQDARNKISIANKGRKHSDATKQRMSQSRTGAKLSEEHRANISQGQLGRAPNVYTDEYRNKISIGNKGKTRTPEQRARYSAAIAEVWRKRKEAAKEDSK